MTTQQLTLLDSLMQQLSVLEQVAKSKPLPIDTASVTKHLGVSGSTLNRAKCQGFLPYRLSVNGGIAEIDFVRQTKGKDYWAVTLVTSGNGKEISYDDNI
jgi:hypothetical protein